MVVCLYVYLIIYVTSLKNFTEMLKDMRKGTVKMPGYMDSCLHVFGISFYVPHTKLPFASLTDVRV